MKPDFYRILGISRAASLEDIRAAYRALARRFHPDKNIEVGETELFLGVQNAYEVLSDPEKREDYDKNLADIPEETPSLGISITYSRNSLVNIDEPQLIYVLMELIPQIHIQSNGSPPLNLCLVLDVSTSMQGRFLDMVKTTSKKLVREMRKQDILSIVTFSDRANILVPAELIRDPKQIESKIQMLNTSGGTEIYQGLQKGYQEVIRHHSKARINHIILITDGRTYGDERDCLLLAEQAAEHGIGISGLGIGDKWNDDFLDALTGKSGGNSLFVTEPEEILNFLSEIIYNLKRRVIQNVTCDFRLDSGVELHYAYRLQPDAANIHIEPPTVLGSMPDKTSLRVVFEFMVRNLKDITGDKHLLDGNLSVDIPVGSYPRENYRISFNLPVSSEYSPQITNPKIVDAMSKLTLYRMQERARQDIAEDKPLEAARRLQQLATQLFARGEIDLAEVVKQEAKSLETNDQISEQGQKQIKYGTRSLLLPDSHEDQT